MVKTDAVYSIETIVPNKLLTLFYISSVNTRVIDTVSPAHLVHVLYSWC